MDICNKINKVINIRVGFISTKHNINDIRMYHKEAQSIIRGGYKVFILVHKSEHIKNNRNICYFASKRKLINYIEILLFIKNNKIDLIHFPDPEIIIIGIILKIMGKKVIYDVYEDFPATIMRKKWIPAILRRFVAIGYRIMEIIAILLFDKMIFAGDDIALKYGTRFRNSIIRNFPILENESSFKNKDRNILRPYTRIVYVGIISENRCIEEMARIARETKEIQFYIAGKFVSNSYKNKVLEPKSRKVKYFGDLKYQDAMKLIRKCDIGYICLDNSPNHEKAVCRNNKLYEYMSFGLPVIVSKLRLWDSFINKYRCGISVDVKNNNRMKETILEYIRNRQIVTFMSDNARRLTLLYFKWKNEEIKLLNIYYKMTF